MGNYKLGFKNELSVDNANFSRYLANIENDPILTLDEKDDMLEYDLTKEDILKYVLFKEYFSKSLLGSLATDNIGEYYNHVGGLSDGIINERKQQLYSGKLEDSLLFNPYKNIIIDFYLCDIPDEIFKKISIGILFNITDEDMEIDLEHEDMKHKLSKKGYTGEYFGGDYGYDLFVTFIKYGANSSYFRLYNYQNRVLSTKQLITDYKDELSIELENKPKNGKLNSRDVAIQTIKKEELISLEYDFEAMDLPEVEVVNTLSEIGVVFTGDYLSTEDYYAKFDNTDLGFDIDLFKSTVSDEYVRDIFDSDQVDSIQNVRCFIQKGGIESKEFYFKKGVEPLIRRNLDQLGLGGI